MIDPTPLERAMIEHTLAGEHPVLAVLREQWATAKVTGRDLTGHVVYLVIDVSAAARVLVTKKQIVLDGPWAELPSRDEPVGALLFTRPKRDRGSSPIRTTRCCS